MFPDKCAICIRRLANGPWVWRLRLRLPDCWHRHRNTYDTIISSYRPALLRVDTFSANFHFGWIIPLIYCIKCYIINLTWMKFDWRDWACANIFNMIRCSITAFFPPIAVIFVVFIFKFERKACSTYLHIHLNATISSVGSIGMFANSIPLLLKFFKLLLTSKRRMKKNFAVSISGPLNLNIILQISHKKEKHIPTIFMFHGFGSSWWIWILCKK